MAFSRPLVKLNHFFKKFSFNSKNCDTGKSVSEALILVLVNPQYDKGLFIEFPEKYQFTTYCILKLFLFCFYFDIQNNICTQHVLNLYFLGNSMNNLSSYCGLTELKEYLRSYCLLYKLCLHYYIYQMMPIDNPTKKKNCTNFAQILQMCTQ